MITTSPRTIEFLFPAIVPNQWFETLTRVWNEALFILRWREHQDNLSKLAKTEYLPSDDLEFLARWIEERGSAENLTAIVDPRLSIKFRKVDGAWQPYQQLFIDRRIDRTKSWEQSNLERVSVFDLDRDRNPWVNPKWLEECPIDRASYIDLCKPFAAKRCPWIAESGISMVLVNDLIRGTLFPAWEAYKKGQRGTPKYKRPGDPIDTISCSAFRGQCEYLGDDWVRFPKLGKVQINGLDLRLFNPIARMVEQMRNNPSAFPAIEKKIDKLVQLERSRLMKADNVDLKAYTKEHGKEAADALKQTYTDRIERSAFLEQTIEYYSSPGSFRIVRRMGKTYIQFSAEMPSTSTPSEKAIGVDTGLDLLVDASNGLRVKYQEFEAREERLVNLNKRISKCVVGSNQWKKLNEKRRSISRKLAKAKAGRPTFYASQIADVNCSIAVRKLKLKESIATPKPRPDGKGGYLPNDAGVIAEQNKLIHGRAIGKFVLLLQQQARKHDRQLVIVDIESEATAAEILEVSELPIVESPKANPLISPCDAPEPVAFVKRDRKRERRIG